MELGIYYHILAEERDGGVWVPGFFGRFLDAVAAANTRLVCFMHTGARGNLALDYRLQASNIRFVNAGPAPTALRGTFTPSRWISRIRKELMEPDVLVVRGPCPLLPALCDVRGKRPTALLLVGNLYTAARRSRRGPVRRLLLHMWASYSAAQQTRRASRHLTFINSPQLRHGLTGGPDRVIEIRTTTLSEGDFVERPDTCLSAPLHVLLTGRLERAKGTLDALEVFAQFVAGGHDAHLDIVGWPAEGTPILAEMDEAMHRLGIRDKVTFHGYRAAGPDLFAYYRTADIYLLPSWDESFPRTIWEAMAHSVPVVSTEVGSIPALVGEITELAPARDIEAITHAMNRVVEDPVRRRAMIAGGLALARQNTQERQVDVMMEHLNRLLQTFRGDV
ncbi:MAG: glycosyltransferase family 4 protein [Armatimonadetes bacterium]|nr:glycosyltransferase family 4 protein [Armatimonadota bacterium]MDE2207792.1 glycosyltransferase family 4 protein [Armatimonadota bacterium]